MESFDPMANRIELLRQLVEKCGGPKPFVTAYRSDDADRDNDPSYVSQILNGHRAFREKASRNMAKRAGLPVDYFDSTAESHSLGMASMKVERLPERMDPIISKVVKIMNGVDRDGRLMALGAVKLVLAGYAKNVGNGVL